MAVLFAASLLAAAPAGAQTPYLSSYKDIQLAQAHCPRDQIVWVNMANGQYYFRGDPLYGQTQHGAYACKHEVDSSGGKSARGQ